MTINPADLPDELVEPVAKALIATIGSPWSWEDMPPEVRGLWFLHARAAIAAFLNGAYDLGYAHIGEEKWYTGEVKKRTIILRLPEGEK
jgi:hypothetical protein